MTYALPEDLGNKILQYLIERPYKEVKDFISGLESLQPVTIVSQTVTSSTANTQGEGSVITDVQSEETKNSEETQSQETNEVTDK